MSWILASDGKVTIEAIKEFNTQSPRTVAIVGAAILEDGLERVISKRFPIDGATKAELFKSTGPLGNLDTKVKVAYAMGLVSKAAFADLQRIVQIRNKFAHRLDIAAFDHPEVSPLCQSLTLVDRHLFPLGMSIEETNSDASPKMFIENLQTQLAIPRGRYFLGIMLLSSVCTPIALPTGPKPSLPRPLI